MRAAAVGSFLLLVGMLEALAQPGPSGKVPPQLPPQASDKAQEKVAAKTAPTVSMTAPAAGALYTAPAAVLLQAAASASSNGKSIAQVEFFAGATPIGTVTAAPYTFNWNNVAAGSYSLTARATDNLGMTAASPPVAIVVNAPPSVSITSPANGAVFTAPASIPLTAEVVDADGMIARVDFFDGLSLIGTRTMAPYSIVLTDVPQGAYSLSALVTDNQGAVTTSSAVSVTVNSAVAQIYFIHTDHLNTPRLITNNVGQAVWSWNNDDPFGANVPNENPSTLGNFTCNLRLPGQYFDRETNLYYNYFRDYDAAIGRYQQFDPIGLRGGVNGYDYVTSNPLGRIDLYGLAAQTAGSKGKEKMLDCGPEGGILSYFIPNNPRGYPFHSCCDAHDRCYDKCFGPDKLTCDSDGCNCFKSACSGTSGSAQGTCLRLAQEYCYRIIYSETADEQFRKARAKCRSSAACIPTPTL